MSTSGGASGSGGPPSGPAGGDLAGTYPGPTLKVIGSAVGPLGSATRTNTATIDNKGRVTALTDQAIALTATGDATGTLPGALTLKNTGPGVTGPIGSATIIPIVTIDAQGRVTALTQATANSPVGGLAVYGDGSDGTITFDGTTTVLGLAPSSSVYTLTRDIYLAAATINSGVTIITNGFRIHCAGTLTNNGTISWNGNAGTNAGVAGAALGTTLGSIVFSATYGAIGGVGNTGNGSAGGNQGTRSVGGSGGAGGTGVASTGGTAGAATAAAAAFGTLRAAPFTWFGGFDNQNQGISASTGGAGGGGGGGDATNKGGGGGSGGGKVIVIARLFAGTGAIQARGGAGGNGSPSSTLGAGGGGGGGGGDVSVTSSSVVAGAISGQTIDANGGIGGTHSGATATDGANGANGLVVILPN